MREVILDAAGCLSAMIFLAFVGVALSFMGYGIFAFIRGLI